MTEPTRSKTYETLYLILGILAIVSCVPLPAVINLIMGLAVFGLTLYMLITVPKGGKRRSTLILLLVASVLELLFYLIVFALFGGLIATTALADSVEHHNEGQMMSMVAGLLGSLVLAFASWVVRIVGTVFAFITYSSEKQQAFDETTHD